MNTTEFAEKCRVTPQVVRLWVRTGKLEWRGRDLRMAPGYILLPRVCIRKGEGIAQMSVTEANARSVRMWLSDGRAKESADGMLTAAQGYGFVEAYRPVKQGE